MKTLALGGIEDHANDAGVRHSRFLACALVLAGAMLASSRAYAHDPNLSRTDLVEGDAGGIHGRFTFAASDAKNAFDRDGHVSIDVKTDGASCAPGPVTTMPDGDGVIVDEDFACTRATASIEATLYFVTELGSTHEDIARIAVSESSHEELLRAPHRTILLELHRKPKAEAPLAVAWRPWLVLGTIAAVALLIVFASWRGARRSRMKNP
ncbi:MAG TPA: hypothetical protein VGH87_04235 [Polyangiaceae bacterium]